MRRLHAQPSADSVSAKLMVGARAGEVKISTVGANLPKYLEARAAGQQSLNHNGLAAARTPFFAEESSSRVRRRFSLSESQHFLLCLQPVIQGSTMRAAAGLIKHIGALADLLLSLGVLKVGSA